MKEFFADVFEYHHHFNQKVADLLMENKDNISERTVPLFSHCMNAHQIWNSRIMGTASYAVHQIHTLPQCKAIDRDNYANTLKILNELELDKTIEYKTSKGDAFSNTLSEIFFHISNHSTHHKGQIISDLRQSGIEPPVTDYIFYKR
ncbi:MAG: DinB family protein [Cyclobacteriaceae bacterium]